MEIEIDGEPVAFVAKPVPAREPASVPPKAEAPSSIGLRPGSIATPDI
jgi:hypothetical protein